MMRYKNNPCNIRWSSVNNWRGQIAPKNGFCQFADLEFGIRATLRLLENYRKKNHLYTIGKIVSRFAPPKENATFAYIKYVCDCMNRSLPREGYIFEDLQNDLYTEDTELNNRIEYAFLVKYIAFIESRTELDVKHIFILINKYNLFKDLWKNS